MKSLAIILLMTLSTSVGCSSSSEKEEITFDAPLPICSDIKSYQAYEMAKAVKSRCDPQGVSMTIMDLHKTFLPMMTDEFASVSECNTDCTNLNNENATSMEKCVENNLVGTFVRSAMSSGVYNKDNCEEMRSKIPK